MSARKREKTVVLEAQLGIADARELAMALDDAADGASAVHLDASNVERVDTAALQLFVVYIRYLRERGKAVHWKEPSGALCSAATLLGLHQELGLAEAYNH